MDKNFIKNLAKHAAHFERTVYRSTAIKYANAADILSGQGSFQWGGRWNPIGIRAVYGSMSPEAAMAETLAHVRYYGLPVHSVMPRTFIAIRAKLGKVLDLTNKLVQKSGKFRDRRFTAVNWRAELNQGRKPITQQVGQAAAELGLEGIIVPSSASSGEQNLVCFVDNLAKSSEIIVLSPENLDA